MKRKSAPHSEPISDLASGLATRVGGADLLSSAALAGGAMIASGEFVIRYGITLMGKPQFSIVPDLVVADYGELLTGEAAWDFMQRQGHLYPRADVCGYMNTGEREMLPLKLLDFDYPYDVFVYHYADDDLPFTKVSALVTAEPERFPARLREHLPHFTSLSAWQHERA